MERISSSPSRLKTFVHFINSSFTFSLLEIEALLLAHAMIKDCGVVGRPDEFAGELPLAFIVRKDPNLSEHEVIKYVSDNASPANRLHGGVVFVDEIPKNPSGKILRRKLRTMLNCELKSKL